MRIVQRSFSFITLLAAAGLLQTAGAQGEREQSATAPRPATGRFTGSLRAVSSRQVTDWSQFSGSVEIIPAPEKAPGIYKITIRMTTSLSGGSANILQWSVAPGRCGTMFNALIPPNDLPPLNQRPGGDAEMSWEGPMALADKGSYQAAIFLGGGSTQGSLLGCAALKYEAPKNK